MILLGRFLNVLQFSPLEGSSSLVHIGPSSVDTSVETSVGETIVGLSLSIALSVVVTAKGGVWAVDTSVGKGETIAPGIRLGLSVTLSKVVVTAKGGVWAVSTSIGETIVAPGIRLGFGITLSVVVTAIGGVWAVDTSVGETIVAPGIRLGFGTTLSKVVVTAKGVVWGVDTSVSEGETIAPGIRLGLGITLAIEVTKTIDVGICTVDGWGSHNRGNMVNTMGVEQGRVSLSLGLSLGLSLRLSLTFTNQVVAGGVENSWLVDNSSGVGQMLDVLLISSQFRSSLLLGSCEVRGDCARFGVEFQTSVDGADNWGNNTTNSWDTSVKQSGV